MLVKQPSVCLYTGCILASFFVKVIHNLKELRAKYILTVVMHAKRQKGGQLE